MPERVVQFPVWLFWSRFTLRHARKEWIQTLLMLLIMAIGVGTFQSIRMANRSAVEGFRLFTETLNGPSDWIIQAPGSQLPIEYLGEIRDVLDGIPADIYPVVEGRLAQIPSIPGSSEESIRLLGLDLVQFQFSEQGDTGLDPDVFWDIIEDPVHILLSIAVSKRLNAGEGDPVRLVMDGKVETFTVRGILPESLNGSPLPANMAIVDLKALLERTGQAAVDRAEIIVPGGRMHEEHIDRAGQLLEAAGEGRWIVRSANEVSFGAASMTAAFRLNLTVLSLIALLIGIYLIAQALDSTVSRRRKEISTLQSLGVSSRDIYRLWLSEAMLYGICAGLMGLLLGYGMAHLTVQAVTATIQSLYQDTVETALKVSFADVLLCMGLGLGASLIAAWLPARDAASTPPAQYLRLGTRIPPFPIFKHPVIGGIMVLAGCLLLLVPPFQPSAGTRIPVAGYLAAFLWLSGGTLLVVSLINGSGRVIRFLSGGNPMLKLAGSRLVKPTSRHQLALCGFFVSIGMAASMGYLIQSFETTVTKWLDYRLRADLFISSVGFNGSVDDPRISAELLDRIEEYEEVEVLDRYRGFPATYQNIPFTIGGTRHDLLGRQQDLLWINGPVELEKRPDNSIPVGYANENFMRRTGMQLGDTVTLQTPAGEQDVLIGGVHADYARDNGLLLVDLKVLEDWYSLDNYDTAALFVRDGASIDRLQRKFQVNFPGLEIRQNGELKETALAIFYQTFAVTRALQLIGLVVALSGLSISLLSLLRESGRELALQRMLGMSRREISMATAIEGTAIAVSGLLSGLVLSFALGWVLIFIINRQSFGWSLIPDYPWVDILQLGISVVLLAFLTSLATGWLYLRKFKLEV